MGLLAGGQEVLGLGVARLMLAQDDADQVVGAALVVALLHLRRDLVVGLGDHVLHMDAGSVVAKCAKRIDAGHARSVCSSNVVCIDCTDTPVPLSVSRWTFLCQKSGGRARISAMRIKWMAAVIAAGMACALGVKAEDLTARVKKAVEKSTLDQPGTKPFHLKAILAPSLAREMGSGRTGEVEIWWAGPDKWRREVRSPDFHQIEIVSEGKDWQKNDGDYFPEWLRQIAVALVKPLPDVDKVLALVGAAEIKKLAGSTYIKWGTIGTDGTVSKGIGATFAISDATDLPFYGGDVGWDGLYHDYQDFHGRMVARTVSSGTPEVTAKVITLEDLKSIPPQLFDNGVAPGDPPIQSRTIDELTMRKNLLPQNVAAWPKLEQGPVEGVMITDVTIDRQGKVRQIDSIVSDNPGLNTVARERIGKMQFKPYLVDGVPIQVVTTITLPFKTIRPEGVENFGTARSYFERGRKAGFIAMTVAPSYMLHADFTTRDNSGNLAKGTYVDTCKSATEWRREATLGKSRVVRAESGDKRYLLAEGPDQDILKVVLREMEPLPITDGLVESDWRMKREVLDGIATIRVARGYRCPTAYLIRRPTPFGSMRRDSC